MKEYFRRFWKAAGRKGGFSLIEMLIGLVILSLLVVALLSLYSKGQQQFINENARAEILEDSRAPFAWIARDVKSAIQVAANWGGYTTSDNTLVLQVPSVDSKGLIIDVDADFDYIIYLVSNNRLQRIIDAKEGTSARVDGSRYLADNVTEIRVTYFDDADNELSSGFDTAASVNVSLSTSLEGFQRTFQESLNSRFKLRNK